MAKASISVGLNRGYSLKKRAKVAKPSQRKGTLSKKRAFVKDVIREVAGFAPYEKRIMELLRNGLDKRALKLTKRRIGTHSRSKRKRDELAAVIQRSRAQA